MSASIRRAIGLTAAAAGLSIAPLDTSVNVAFPYITAAFAQPMAMIQWVVICYVLTYAALMLIFGKLGDLYGHKRVFAAGLVVSIAALSLVALSPNFAGLLGFRVLQGVGSGLVTSVGPALIIGLYPDDQRGRALGAFAFVYATASMLGPLVGGMLVEWFDWRAVFWFRVPVAAGALILLTAFPSSPTETETAPGQNHRFRQKYDYAGAITLILAIGAFLLTLNQLQHIGQHGWLPALGFAGIFMLASIGFIRAEQRAPAPILRLAAFRNLTFTIVNLASCLLYMATFAVMLLIPFLLPRLDGLSVSGAGLILAAGFIGASLAALPAGRLVGRVQANRIGFVGIALCGVGLSIIGQAGGAHLSWMVAGLLIQGVGAGCFQVAYLFIVTGMLPPSERGVSGSLAMLTRTIGVISAVTMLTMIFGLRETAARRGGASIGESFEVAFRDTFTLAGAALLVFLLATMVRARIWFGTPQDPQQDPPQNQTGAEK